MDRRHFVRLLGLAGLSAGLGPAGIARASSHAGQSPIRRLILISHCHGWPYDSWKMRPDGLPEDAAWDIPLADLKMDAFSQPLAPLFDHRARMLAIDGLSLATAELDMDGNRHDTGWVHSWTGNRVDFSGSEARSTSASLDQLVAAHIARSDRLPSLELGVEDAREAGRPISYSPNGQRLPVETDPVRVWQRLFGPTLAPNPLLARQGSALDFAHGEFAALAPRLGAGQRHKLEAHFELVKRLSDRLEGMASLSCDAPPVPEGLVTYDDRFDAMSELIGASFACDITRVVCLSLGEMSTSDFGWDHLTDDVHKGLAHGIYDNADKHQAMTDYLTRHAGQIARLVDLLSGIPDTDGGSIMDNTLIAWGSELADGWHGYRHYNPVLLGGSWHFDTGRYVYLPHETPIEVLVPPSVQGGGYTAVSGLPHQHLLVSVAQAMGLTTEHVGIEQIQGQRGDLVYCDGPVPNLVGGASQP